MEGSKQKASSYFQPINCTVSEWSALLLHCLHAQNNGLPVFVDAQISVP